VGVRWWAVVSSVVEPVAMIGGWLVAAGRQRSGYSAIRDTISALAAYGAHDRWVMTAGLAVVGSCHIVTAAGLRIARPVGRVLLAAGGMATILVAAMPEPVQGSSLGHTVAAGTAFVALSIWPLAARTSPGSAGAVNSRASIAATVGFGILLVVFYLELHGGRQIGLTERLLAGAQSLWPAAVAVGGLRLGRPQPDPVATEGTPPP
jgi:hypothetical membrane protein